MPIGTPFHPRTSALCESMSWREWAGYFAVSQYEATHEREYNAIRQSQLIVLLIHAGVEASTDSRAIAASLINVRNRR